MQWCDNGSHCWKEVWEVRTDGGERCFTAPPFSTQEEDWLSPLTLNGYRGSLAPSPGYLKGWGSGTMTGRHSGCSAAHAVCFETTRRRPTSDRLWERVSPTCLYRSCGYIYLTVDQTWRRGCLRPTTIHKTLLAWEPSGRPPPPAG